MAWAKRTWGQQEGRRRLTFEPLECRRLLDAGGQIFGTAWHDLNADGARDFAEPVLPEWQIYLDADQDGRYDLGEPTTLTGVDGSYSFTGLAAGTYSVAEVLPDGWRQTLPAIDAGLTFLEVHKDGVAGVSGLDGAEEVAVSPDGRHVYASMIVNSTVALFRRDTQTGQLTFVEFYEDGVGGLDGLRNAHWLTLSNDGRFVYVSGRGDDAIAVLARDETSGQLSFVEIEKDGVAGVDGLNFVGVTALSPDGLFLYATGREDDAVAVFARDPADGTLTFLAVYKNNTLGITSMDQPRGVVVSPDGKNVYVSNLNGDSLTVFTRDTTNGLLTFFELHKNGVGGVTGLDQVPNVVVSRDGKNVMTIGVVDDSVVVFARDPSNGHLTFQAIHRDGVNGVHGQDGPIALRLSPDDRHLLVAGYFGDEFAEYVRDPLTGNLQFVAGYHDDTGGLDGLKGAHAMAYSPNGRNVYVGGFGDDAVAVFRTPFQSHPVTLAEGQTMGSLDFGNHRLNAANHAPLLAAIANQAVAENSLLVVTALASDPDGDMLEFELLSGPAGVTIDPASGVIQWLPSDSSADPFVVMIRVTDDGLEPASDVVSFAIIVHNVAPSGFAAGPSPAIRGETISLMFSASDVSPVDQASDFTYAIDWDGNGTIDQTIVGPGSGVTLAHTFVASGNYPVRLTVTDKDGGQNQSLVQNIEVTDYALRDDGQGSVDLVWGGTPGFDGVFFLNTGVADNIAILAQFENSAFVAKIAIVSGVTGKVIAYGYDSDDVLVGEFLASRQAYFIGGAGNDLLVGGFLGDRLDGGLGHDLLLGGTRVTDGGDTLLGSDGDDVLIGFTGADSLDGGAGDDLLLGDAILFADLPAAALSIHAEWSLSGHSLVQRRENLTGINPQADRLNGEYFLVPGVSLIRDAAVDTLVGGSEIDWFVYSFFEDLTVDVDEEDEFDVDP